MITYLMILYKHNHKNPNNNINDYNKAHTFSFNSGFCISLKTSCLYQWYISAGS
jgi:hypothetical protein